MLDLELLCDSSQFGAHPSEPTRIAMVHLGFRSISMRRGVSRQRFAAHFPALGLLNLAHALRTDAARNLVRAAEIAYFDDGAYADLDELAVVVERWLASARRRIVAASVYTSTVDALESFLRKFDPRKYLIICGGPHATVAPDLSACHVVVRGEGRRALRHVVNCFLTDDFGRGEDTAGLNYCLRGRERLETPAFDRSIEELPSPGFAYDLLPEDGLDEVYATNFTRMLGRRPQIYVCTQSCRARCTFCSTYLIHGRPVARPVELVEQDLEYLVHGRGHDSLEFHDDDLMQHPALDELLAAISRVGVPWFCYARVDLIDDYLAARLAASGCRRVFLGVEAMTQDRLDYFGKGTTVAGNQRAVQALAAAGIGVVAGFIIGAPSDTVQTVLAELDAFLQLPLFAINCSILSPDPGTVEFHRARKRQDAFAEAFGAAAPSKRLRVVPDVKRFGLGTPIGLPTVCHDIGKADLNRLVAIVDGAFYFRPHIWDGLTATRSRRQQSTLQDYYHLVLTSLEGIDPTDAHPGLIQPLQRAIVAGRHGPWSATV